MTDIVGNINAILEEIKPLKPNYPVTIIAVSKNQPSHAIETALQAGITHFGESYWQEAEKKIIALQHLPLTWHFIGDIQTNKCAAIGKSVDWVHSVSRLKIAQRLSDSRKNLPPLNVCIQVNLNKEPNKSGLAPGDVIAFIQQILSLPNIIIRGLMAIPQILTDTEKQYQNFLQLHALLLECNQSLELTLDTLSMGMSDDYLPAIKAGSTMVRIGRAIFGNR